jgi:threonine/homoserine/homoserine lactone efflux protein
MITALASGAFLGLSCGLAPGPLLALLLAQTLRHARQSVWMLLTGRSNGLMLVCR